MCAWSLIIALDDAAAAAGGKVEAVVLAMKRVKCGGGVRVDYSIHSATKMLNLQQIKRKTAFVVMTIIKFQCNNNSNSSNKYEKLEQWSRAVQCEVEQNSNSNSKRK